jgi:anti-sigma factor RsiW
LTDDDIAEWDAAYVLGALARRDRNTYEAFLAADPERTAALKELADLLGRLNILSCDEALALL